MGRLGVGTDVPICCAMSGKPSVKTRARSSTVRRRRWRGALADPSAMKLIYDASTRSVAPPSHPHHAVSLDDVLPVVTSSRVALRHCRSVAADLTTSPPSP